jgi:hypothetical protein
MKYSNLMFIKSDFATSRVLLLKISTKRKLHPKPVANPDPEVRPSHYPSTILDIWIRISHFYKDLKSRSKTVGSL